jgi:uncharacterized repeat protein (TIGR03803 family)
MMSALRHRGLIFEAWAWLREMSMLVVTVMLLPILAIPVAHAQTFTGGADGGFPYAGLVRDKAGNLYGTTLEGGISACGTGCGTVFKLDKHRTETVLHRFTGNSEDGAFPWAGLVVDAAGNLYGTTSGGGLFGWGSVFKLSKTSKEKVLYSFSGGLADGKGPLAGLV